MGSDCEISTTDIEAVTVPDLAARVAAARSNANFAQNPGVSVSKITGVVKKKKTQEDTSNHD